MPKRALSIVVVLAALAAVTFTQIQGAGATTVTIVRASADVTVDAAHPSVNYGASRVLRLDASPATAAFARFVVRGVYGRVTKAQLLVYSLSDSRVGYQTRTTALRSWSERRLTMSSAPAVSRNAVGSSGQIDSGEWSAVDLTNLVDGNGTYSLALTTASRRYLLLTSRESNRAPRLRIAWKDATAPSTPTQVTAFEDPSGGVALTWHPSTDNWRVDGYTVYRDGDEVATVDGPETDFVDSAVPPEKIDEASYTVDAFDPAGNHSVESSPVVVTDSPQVSSPASSPATSPSGSPSSAPAPSTAPDAVIAAAGDIVCDGSGTVTATTCRHKQTSDIVANGKFDGFLALGDLQYQTGALSDYQKFYDPTWGRVKSITYPTPGNHEYSSGVGASGYFGYFGARAGDPGKGYYSFNLGSWHLIALNSNCSSVGGCGSGSAQLNWLVSDLAANSRSCTLAFWHHARFSSGEHGDNTAVGPLWQALYDRKADVVLVGHDHDYERFAPQNNSGQADANGIREFVVGTGGKSQRTFASVKANSEKRNAGTFGVLKMVLHASSYDWQFVPEAGGSFTDSGSANCVGAATVSPSPSPSPTRSVSPSPSPSSGTAPSGTTATAPVAATSCDVNVAPGSSIQSAIDSHAATSTLCLGSGTYSIGSPINPKSGNSIIGNGRSVLTGGGSTQYAFNSSASNVTVAGLVIERFNSPLQQGAVHINGSGWTVRDNEIRNNSAAGVFWRGANRILRNNIHHNGQEGYACTQSANALFEGNEVAYNNTRGIDPGWEAGGGKCSETDHLTLRNNYSHHNTGPGMWTDINNIHTVYEGNRVENNTGYGIFHEISYDAVIRNNTITGNGDSWGWMGRSGIFVANSPNVEVSGNTLSGNGIAGVQQRRGSGKYGAWILRGFHVHDNKVTVSGGHTGWAEDVGDAGVWAGSNWFQNNQYTVPSGCSCWSYKGNVNWTAWRGAGQDASGTVRYV